MTFLALDPKLSAVSIQNLEAIDFNPILTVVDV
jgi:hypothetical protein